MLDFKFGDIFKVVLEFFGNQRRHRKELQAREELGVSKRDAELRAKETSYVQEAGAADNTMQPDDADGVRDPNNTYSSE